MSLRGRLGLVGLIWVAALLRAYDLDHMSLWTDEGLSFYRAGLSVAGVLSGHIPVGEMPTRDVQPPLYFLLLKGWLAAVGFGTWQAKFASLLLSLPPVALTWAVAKRLTRPATAWVAAAFVAASPVLLWYGQEVRHYTLLLTLTLMATYGVIRGLGFGAPPNRPAPGAAEVADGAEAHRSAPRAGDVADGADASGDADGHRPRPRWLILAVVAAGAALYTHYLAFFVLAALGLTGGLLLLPGDRRTSDLPPWVWLAGLATAAAALPLVPFAFQRLAIGPERDQHFVPLTTMISDVFRGFPLGLTTDMARVPVWLIALLVALPMAGLLDLIRRRARSGPILAVLVTAPVVGLYLLTYVKPVYMGVRHIITALPAHHILLAAGVTAVAGWATRPWVDRGGPARSSAAFQVLAAVLAALILFPMLAADLNAYRDDGVAKDDLRGLARYVETRAVPGDVLVLSDPVLEHAFRPLLDPEVPVTSVPRPGDPRSLDEHLRDLADTHRRIWFMTPGNEALAWLDQHLVEVDRQSFGGRTIPVRVRAFQDLPEESQALIGGWLGSVHPPGPPEPGLDLITWSAVPQPATPGDLVRITLVVPAGIDGPDRIALRLIGPDGREYGASDHAPFHGARGPEPWTANRDRLPVPQDLVVDPGAPPGTYRVALRTISATGAPAPEGGDFFLGYIDVAGDADPIRRDHWPIPDAPTLEAAGIRLLGARLPDTAVPHGDRITIPVWYQRSPEDDAGANGADPGDAGGTPTVELVAQTSGGPATATGALSETGVARVDLVLDTSELLPAGDGAETGAAGADTAESSASKIYPVSLTWRLRSSRGDVLAAREQAPTDSGRLSSLRRRLGLMPAQSRGLRLARVPRQTTVPDVGIPVGLAFGDVATLARADWRPRTATAGSRLTVTLAWQVDARPESDLKATVQLLPPTDAPDHRPVAQHDGVPAEGARPVGSWLPGEVIVDEHVLMLPPDAAPGTYRLLVALYQPGSGERLTVRRPEGVDPAAGGLSDGAVVGVVEVSDDGAGGGGE